MTTQPLLFIGDTLEVNANAPGGSVQVEATDPDGNAIEGFAKDNCAAISTDSAHHVIPRTRGRHDLEI